MPTRGVLKGLAVVSRVEHGCSELANLGRRHFGVATGKVGEAHQRLGLIGHGVLDV